MIPVSVKVTGPGGCIDSTFKTVYAALIQAGAKVTVVAPPAPGGNHPDLSGLHVTLFADDQPWGG